MSTIRLKTLKRELMDFLADVLCIPDFKDKIDFGNFVVDEKFEDNWDDLRSVLHSIKLRENRITKQIRDYKKSVEKNKKDPEISI